MICAGQGGICLKSSAEIDWSMLDCCTISSWILLPPAPRENWHLAFLQWGSDIIISSSPGLFHQLWLSKSLFLLSLWESEMESERIENRNVVEQRIKRPGKREDRSCPRIQELSILSWSHLASSEFWFISYIIWPWSKNNLLYKDFREIVDLPLSTGFPPSLGKGSISLKSTRRNLFFCSGIQAEDWVT